MSMSNALVLTQLLLGYATKLQDIANLFTLATLEKRDLTDAEVEQSSLKADVAIAKAQAAIDAPRGTP